MVFYTHRERPDLGGPHGPGAVRGGGRLPEAGELGDQPQRGAGGGHHREERVRWAPRPPPSPPSTLPRPLGQEHWDAQQRLSPVRLVRFRRSGGRPLLGPSAQISCWVPTHQRPVGSDVTDVF